MAFAHAEPLRVAVVPPLPKWFHGGDAVVNNRCVEKRIATMKPPAPRPGAPVAKRNPVTVCLAQRGAVLARSYLRIGNSKTLRYTRWGVSYGC